MSIEQEIAGLTQSTTDLLDAVNTKKATLDTAVSNAQTAVTDATSQVSLAAAEKVGAQAARDEAETHKDQAYTYSQSAASAVAYQDLTAIAESKVETAVDVFVYDTRKDSDGGAWRKRTQGTSWYNEPLNTATRGSRKEFPAVAVIVAEAGKVTIYDGDDPSLPMWMVFLRQTNSIWRYADHSTTSIFALNGIIAIGKIHPLNYGGVALVRFTADNIQGYTKGRADTAQGVYKGAISQRNDALGWDITQLELIVDSRVNDVAMTVLPDAPIDQDTGLPIPTIAVATDGGVSVIKDDGTVVDWTRSVATVASQISFRPTDNALCLCFDNNTNGRFRHVLYDLPSSDVSDIQGYSKGISDEFYPMFYSGAYIDPSMILSRNSSLTSNGWNGLADAGMGQLSLISPNKTDHTKGMLAVIERNYNTGWMNGDIKLATLSDTDDTDLVGTELITNGTFDSDTTGWNIAGTGASFAVIDGQLVITRDGTSAVAQQAITTVVGKTYVFAIDFVATSGDAKIGLKFGATVGEITGTTGRVSVTHTAISTSTLLEINTYNTASGTLTVDNASVRLAEPDRSVNGNGLQVFGTVQKSPVATGADLMAYSGFSSTNYLMQPYNPDLDFGTGDFCLMGWVKVSPSYSGTDYFLSRGTHLGYALNVNAGNVAFYADGSDISTAMPSTATWFFVCAGVRSGQRYLSVNAGAEVNSSITTSVDEPNATLILGKYSETTAVSLNGSLALWRISATAPTAEQIAKIYRDEKPLFQENAQATLHGTSDAVTALAFDQYTDLLHVGTSAGRSVFSGLQRVDNTTDAVGTAISASNGLVAEE